MKEPREMGQYFRTMIREGLYSTEKKLRFHLSTVFKEVQSFEGRTVLDIGGGAGLHSFYAACKGAAEVVCIEPEDAGSNSGVRDQFRRFNELLGTNNVYLEPTTVQEFDAKGRTFDIVLLHDSINHLDENACVTLLDDDASWAVYKDIFTAIHSLIAPGGLLIVCDCSRYNIFATLGLRNPITPTIEWEKHQSPKVWARLLGQVGFGEARIAWPSFNRLGLVGQLLLGNGVAAYFLKSYFCLTMRKR